MSRPESYATSRFYYPRRGYGQISEAYCQAALKAGAAVRLWTSLISIERDGTRCMTVKARGAAGNMSLPARQVMSTIPLSCLVQAIRPVAPAAVLTSATALKYRAMVPVYLVLETDRFTEYDAHYFPEAEICLTRVSEPSNYSGCRSSGTTILCAESRAGRRILSG